VCCSSDGRRLGLGFWYNRRRLAGPFARIAQALQRVAEGQFVEPLPEDQPGEFGAIARGVNHMAKALAWREELQAYLSQLLAASTRRRRRHGRAHPGAGSDRRRHEATGVVLYQPAYDSNEWAPSVSRGVESRPISRATMRDLMGDGGQAAPSIITAKRCSSASSAAPDRGDAAVWCSCRCAQARS